VVVEGKVGGRGVEGSLGGGERSESRFFDEGLIDGSATGHDDFDGLIGLVTSVLRYPSKIEKSVSGLKEENWKRKRTGRVGSFSLGRRKRTKRTSNSPA